MDEVTDISVTPPDPEDAMVQEIKGHKVLATPAVRRLARENNVSVILKYSMKRIVA